MTIEGSGVAVPIHRLEERYRAYLCPLCGAVSIYWPTMRDHVCTPPQELREPQPWSLDTPGAVSQGDDGCYEAGAVDTPGLHRPDCNAIRNGGTCDVGRGAVS